MQNRPSTPRPEVRGQQKLLTDRWRHLWVLSGCLCLVVMSVSGLNVALPDMQESLPASHVGLQLITDGYAVVFAGLLLSGGAASDRFGKRRMLMLGLAVFAFGAALGPLVGGFSSVFVGRLIMGVGAAGVMPATLSIVGTIFPNDERPKAIAIWASFAGAGGALGPLVSGVFVSLQGWESALAVNVPVAIALLILARKLPSLERFHTPLDLVGSVLSVLGIGLLVAAVIGLTSPEIDSKAAAGGLFVALAVLVAFVRWERRRSDGLLPLPILSRLSVALPAIVIMVSFALSVTLLFLNALLLQSVLGYPAVVAGAATLPFAVATFASSQLSGRVLGRIAVRSLVAGGLAIASIGFLLPLLTIGSSGNIDYPVLFVTYLLVGSGLAAAVTPATISILSAVPRHRAGIASAINDVSRELGAAIGVAFFGGLAFSLYGRFLNLDDTGLTRAQGDHLRSSLAAAQSNALEDQESGPLILERVSESFIRAFGLSSLAAAMSCLVAACVVMVLWPRPSNTAGRRDVLSEGLDNPDEVSDPFHGTMESQDS